jgi:hypothetical protein
VKIAILDFTTGEVIIEEVPEKWHLLDGDDIISEMGYRMSDVEYMIIEQSLSLNIKTETLTLKTTIE